MKIDLKRKFKMCRDLLAAGAVATGLWFAGSGTASGGLILSNGSFESPSVGGGYAAYTVGSIWKVHNLGASYYAGQVTSQGDHLTGNNGNLVQFAEANVSTGGNATGNQYAAAVLWDTDSTDYPTNPAGVFSGTVGSVPTAGSLYVDQTVGTLNSIDAASNLTLTANLIRIIGQVADVSNGFSGAGSPSVAGAGITIGFANANTGAILAQTPISYTNSYGAYDSTTVSITGGLTWSPTASGIAAGTPINVFVGFRLDPNYTTNYLNSVAVDNVVLTETNNFPNLTWTGSDSAHPTQWSTSTTVLNWSQSGSATHYSTLANVTFDDTVAGGSNVVDISVADVTPASVIFNNNAVSYTVQGTHAIAGVTNLVVSGGGLVTLLNNNTYTGGTVISSGTLQLGNGGTTGSIVGDVVNNGSLIIDRSDSATIPGGLSGTGSLAVQGTNLLVLSGPNDQYINNALPGVTVINKIGSGNLFLSAANIVTGSLNVTAGVVQENVSSPFASTAAITLSNATLAIRYGSYSINELNVASLTLAGGATLEAAPQYQADNGDIGFQNSITVIGTNTVYAAGGSYGKNNWLQGGMTGGTSAYVYLSNGYKYGDIYADAHAIILSGGDWSHYSGTINAVNDASINGTVNLINANVIDNGSFGFYSANSTAEFGSLSGSGTLTDNSISDLNQAQHIETGGQFIVGYLGTSTTFSGALSGGFTLSKVGSGALTLSGANSTFAGITNVNAGVLNVTGALGGTTNVTAGTLALQGSLGGLVNVNGGLLDIASGNVSGTTNVNAGTLAVQGSLGGSVNVNAGLLDVTSGSVTGGSALSVYGGTLLLDYSSANTAKVGGVALALVGGTVALNGGSTTDTVGSTLLMGSPTVTRLSGTSVLGLGTITNAGGLINFTAPGIATTNNLNTNGILGGWATVGGTAWAANSTNAANGSITAYTAYTNVPLGGTIASNVASNIQLTGGASGNIVLGSTFTTVNSLLQSETGATTVSLGSGTLNLAAGALLVPAGKGALTIGVSPGSGTLTTGASTGSAGNLTLINNSTNNLTVNSSIANNGGGSLSLTKAGPGTVVLNGVDTYSGLTSVVNGTLQGSSTAIPGAVVLQNNASVVYNQVSTGIISGPISGVGSFTKSGAGLLTVTGVQTYSGPTYISGGTVQVLGANATGLYEGLVSNNNAFDLTDPIPLTSVQPVARWGASTTSGVSNIFPSWGNNTTWGYAGYLDNTSSNSITYNFGKNFDDSASLIIDGVSIINDGTYNKNVNGSAVLSPGLHTVDLRFGQGGGGVGPNTGAYNNFGISYNTTGNTATTGTWLQMGASDPNTAFYATTSIGGLPTATTVVLSNNATLDLSNSATVATTIALLSDATPGSSTGAQILLGSNALTIGANNSNNTFSGNISGIGGSLTVNGTGTFTLAGSNSYTGTTSIQGGILQLGSNTAYPSGSALSISSGSINVQGYAASASTVNVAGGIVGTHGGSLAVSSILNFNGNTAISNVAVADAGDAWFLSTGTLTIPSGTSLSVSGNFYLTPPNGNVLGVTNITGGTLTVLGNAQDARDSFYHVYQSAGVVTLGQLLASQGYPGTANNGGSSYTSYYDLTGGLLTVGNIAGGNATSFSRAIDLNLGGGTLAASAPFTMSANAISLTGVNGNATINTAGFAVSVPGPISGTGGLRKIGAGTLTLTSTGNTYSGGTTINAGVLQLGSSTALGTGGLIVNTAGTLDLGGVGATVTTLAGSGVILNSTGPLSLLALSAGGSFAGSINDGGSQTALALTGGQLTLSGSDSFSGGTTVSGGALILDGAQTLLAGTSLTIGGPAPGAVFAAPSVAQASPLAVAPVPEPGTLGLVAVGFLMAGGYGLQRRLAISRSQ